MSFAVFADGSANLPKSMLEGISLLPCDYTVDGEPYTYWGDVDSFDAHPFYEGLRNGTVVRTTLLNTSLFLSRFAPILTQGIDIIYISMSSGISGTYTYGGMSPETGFDCSGLVKYVFKNAAGMNLPRTSAEQAGVGQSISASELQPGDLIAYDGSDHDGSVNHISIYVGDGMAVHAVGTGKGIRKTKWDYQPAMTIRNVMGD